MVLDELGLVPLFDLQMRLGEGTGAALAMSIIDAAAKTLAEMATFESAGVANRDDPDPAMTGNRTGGRDRDALPGAARRSRGLAPRRASAAAPTPGLSETGRQQAALLSGMVPVGLPDARSSCSPLARARETADIAVGRPRRPP